MVLATESAQLPRRPEFAKAAGSNEPSSATWQITAEPLAAEAATHTAVASSRLDLGRQPNKLGNYYCYNRTYDPNTGRWTTPDPAEEDANLQAYSTSNPLNLSDPSGLFSSWIPGYSGLQRLLSKGAGQPRPGYPTHNSITEQALRGSNVPSCLHDAVLRGATEIDIPGARWGHGDNAALHVDDTRFLDQTERWLAAVREAGDHYKASGVVDCACLGALAYLAGMAAHTIQDFYHHTDWFFVGASGSGASRHRWDEKAKSAHSAGVRTGYGWVKKGEQNNQPKDAARTGPWKHDPWGDHKDDHDRNGMPALPMGFNRLGYLWHVVNTVVTPHTAELLTNVVGGVNVGCCCPKGKLSTQRYQYRNPRKKTLTRCFGPAGDTLAEFVIDQRPTPRPIGE